MGLSMVLIDVGPIVFVAHDRTLSLKTSSLANQPIPCRGIGF